MLTTKASVRMLHRRGSVFFLCSEYKTHLSIGSSAPSAGEGSGDRENSPPCASMTTGNLDKCQGPLAGDAAVASTDGQSAADGDKMGGGEGERIDNASDYASASASASFPARSSSLVPDVKENDTSGDCCSGGDSSLVADPATIENQGLSRGRAATTTVSVVSDEIENRQDSDDGAYEYEGGARRKPRDGKGREEESTEKEKSAAIVIGEVLGSLPLSKLKIVIGMCIQQKQVSDRLHNPRTRRYHSEAL